MASTEKRGSDNDFHPFASLSLSRGITRYFFSSLHFDKSAESSIRGDATSVAGGRAYLLEKLRLLLCLSRANQFLLGELLIRRSYYHKSTFADCAATAFVVFCTDLRFRLIIGRISSAAAIELPFNLVISLAIVHFNSLPPPPIAIFPEHPICAKR